MPHCPICRHNNAVRFARADQLDAGYQNLIMMYFPKEIQEKRKSHDREQAIEDVQAMTVAFTGRPYPDEQLQRMRQQNLCFMM
jgi:hypothetical protein